MLTDANRVELEERGFTVIPGVLTEPKCDRHIANYRKWLSQFKDGNWPPSKASLISRYNIGNFETTWEIRLKTKSVFAQVWGTEKLLTSVDAIAIGRPPEDGEEEFESPGQHWLHTDQSARRKGLHAYQGGVYLETTDEDDWTFHLMEGSHKYLGEFYELNPKRAFKGTVNEYYYLRDDDYEWFKNKGCKTVRLPVPKGGMVLWDSRLIHANAKPMRNRRNPGRWRYTIFCCMTPAIWATKDDYIDRKLAFESGSMTTHWPSQGVRFYTSSAPPSFDDDTITFPTELPPIARSEQAKLLWGYTQYDFNDGQPNGPDHAPEIDQQSVFVTRFPGTPPTCQQSSGALFKRIVFVAAGVSLFTFIVFKYIKHRNN